MVYRKIFQYMNKFSVLAHMGAMLYFCVSDNQFNRTIMRASIEEYKAVEEAAMKFVKSVAEGNSRYAKELFIDEAVLFGYLDGELEHGSIEQFYRNVDTVGAGNDFKARVDVIDVEETLLEADAVVFSTPVYWYSIPAQIKGAIDRLFSFVVGGKDYAGKKWGLITCCEEDDMSVMDGVKIPLERSAALLKWELVGEILVPGVLNEGDIEKTDGCSQAAALARKF